jgi:hypothetical protein
MICVANRENAANDGWQGDSGLGKAFFGEQP